MPGAGPGHVPYGIVISARAPSAAVITTAAAEGSIVQLAVALGEPLDPAREPGGVDLDDATGSRHDGDATPTASQWSAVDAGCEAAITVSTTVPSTH